MKIKKYIGSTMPEIMGKIKSDLGADAVILNTKEVKSGGFLGLFKKRQIEVVAAFDPDPIHPTKRKQPVHHLKHNHYMEKKHEFRKDSMEDVTLLNEIKYIKKMLEKQTKNLIDYPYSYQVVYEYLLEQEVDTEITTDLIDSAVNHFESKEITPTENQIIQHIQLEIENRMIKSSLKMNEQKRIIHFVGPTGVGKTTTLAKIAAKKILKEKKKVAFITLDTYRIAAIDQLKTYANILQVPIEVAYSIEDYHQAVQKFKSYDFILVDTAGRNYRENRYIKDLPLVNEENTQVFLVLSLTAKPKDIVDIYRQFSHLQIKNVIFTKIDETTQFGSLLNITLRNDVNISYITNGQDVPDDIFKPTPKHISNYVLGGYFNHE